MILDKLLKVLTGLTGNEVLFLTEITEERPYAKSQDDDAYQCSEADEDALGNGIVERVQT